LINSDIKENGVFKSDHRRLGRRLHPYQQQQSKINRKIHSKPSNSSGSTIQGAPIQHQVILEENEELSELLSLKDFDFSIYNDKKCLAKDQSEHLESHDEGYNSGGSPVPSGSEESISVPFTDIIFLDSIEDNINSCENIVLDTTCNNFDLSSILLDQNNDPILPSSSELQFEKVAVIDSSDCFTVELKDVYGFGETKEKSTETLKRRGAKQISLDHIVDKTHKKNIIRCREYRCKKTEEGFDTLSELETLMAKNRDLINEEKHLRLKVKHFKETYIKLISEGRVKFC